MVNPSQASRRGFLHQCSSTGASIGAGVALAACGASTAQSTGNTKPTFVFVHGSWHGAWCWSQTINLLAQAGYPCVAVDLPGHGIDAKFPASYLQSPQNPASLATEVSPLAGQTQAASTDHVLKIITGLTASGSGPVVLVGHSQGGATITAVAEAAPLLIKRLVYLTAFVPVKLDSIIAYLGRTEFTTNAEVSPLFAGDPGVIACLRINHNSTDPVYVAQAKKAFYADASDAQFQAVVNLLTPDEPISGFVSKIPTSLAKWGSVPRAYIRCTDDKAIPIAGQDVMIAEADAFTPNNKFITKTLATSHSPFVTNPAALNTALLSLV